jgi:glutamate-1-semialdehyde 2,1-aminomutase
LAAGLARAARAAGVRIAINRVGSMLTPFFTGDRQQAVENYEQAVACDTQAYATFFHAMLQGGVFLPPSQFEAWFVGLAHSAEAIAQTITVAKTAFGAVAAKRAAGQ